MIRDRVGVRVLLLATTVLLFVLIAPLQDVSWAQQAGNADPARKVSDLERLVAIEEIRQLKARYFRCMDMKDWACLDGLFTKDATAEFGIVPPIKGGLAIAAQMRRAVENRVTVHHGHMPEIEVTSPTTARGIWAMEDLLQGPPVHGFGHYHETYERIDGRWYIKTIRLTRLRRDT